MREACLASIGFILEMFIFFAAGRLLSKALKLKGGISLQLILGYLVYFAVFEVVTVPMTLLWVSLSRAAALWAVLLVICLAGGLFLLKRGKKKTGNQRAEQPGQVIPSESAGLKSKTKSVRAAMGQLWSDHSYMLLAVIAVVLIQCLIVVLYEDTTVDATYYVGTVSTSVYTNTLGRYDPFRGGILKSFQARYILSAYPMNNAVWCKLLGIHPIVQAKIVMSCVNVVISNLIIYQIGKRLFEENQKKADLMVIFVCVLQLFCGTIYTAGTFFFTRSYEGKSILANIAFPAVLMCALWFYQKKNEKAVWLVLFLTAASALAFSGSAIIFPAAILAGMIPAMVMNRKFSAIPYCILCMIPSGIYAAVYFACKLGLIRLAAS